MGIKRQLPPPLPDDIDIPQAKEQDVFNVKVNFLDLLLVEGQPLDMDQLKNKAKDFLIATGDGVMTHKIDNQEIGKNRDVIFITGANDKTNAAFPEREWVRKADVKLKIAEYEQIVKIAEWKEKLTTITLLGGDYKELPPSALISMQNDNNTTYNTYLQVQNELQSAVNELRDELALAKFGQSYSKLEDVYSKNKQDKRTLDKITAVRALYPQRISEAEPRDAGSIYY
jgi:hypothetical protein